MRPGEAAEPAAEVRVGLVVGARASALGVEHRLVADHRAGEARDLRRLAQLGDEAPQDDVVEARVAAADEVEVTAQDALLVDAGIGRDRTVVLSVAFGPKAMQRRGGREQLLVGGRDEPGVRALENSATLAGCRPRRPRSWDRAWRNRPAGASQRGLVDRPRRTPPRPRRTAQCGREHDQDTAEHRHQGRQHG